MFHSWDIGNGDARLAAELLVFCLLFVCVCVCVRKGKGKTQINK